MLCADFFTGRGPIGSIWQTEPTQALTSLRFFQNSPAVLQVQVFHLRSRPWGLPEELQAGLDARVIRKASYLDDLPQFLPPMMLQEMVKHHFQSDTMNRIFMLLVAHVHPSFVLNLSGLPAPFPGPMRRGIPGQVRDRISASTSRHTASAGPKAHVFLWSSPPSRL